MRSVSSGRLRVLRVCRPGPKTSAILPSLTNAAIWDSRTVNCAPLRISMSAMGYRCAKMPSSGSLHWMTSMNCFCRKRESGIVAPCGTRGHRCLPQFRGSRDAGEMLRKASRRLLSPWQGRPRDPNRKSPSYCRNKGCGVPGARPPPATTPRAPDRGPCGPGLPPARDARCAPRPVR